MGCQGLLLWGGGPLISGNRFVVGSASPNLFSWAWTMRAVQEENRLISPILLKFHSSHRLGFMASMTHLAPFTCLAHPNRDHLGSAFGTCSSPATFAQISGDLKNSGRPFSPVLSLMRWRGGLSVLGPSSRLSFLKNLSCVGGGYYTVPVASLQGKYFWRTQMGEMQH